MTYYRHQLKSQDKKFGKQNFDDKNKTLFFLSDVINKPCYLWLKVETNDKTLCDSIQRL